MDCPKYYPIINIDGLRKTTTNPRQAYRSRYKPGTARIQVQRVASTNTYSCPVQLKGVVKYLQKIFQFYLEFFHPLRCQQFCRQRLVAFWGKNPDKTSTLNSQRTEGKLCYPWFNRLLTKRKANKPVRLRVLSRNKAIFWGNKRPNIISVCAHCAISPSLPPPALFIYLLCILLKSFSQTNDTHS